MRAYYKAAGRGGVRVIATDPNIDSGLRVDDVVLELFGVPVGHDGKVAAELGDGDVERVSLWLLLGASGAAVCVRRAGGLGQSRSGLDPRWTPNRPRTDPETVPHRRRV